jgi:HK97 family phage major capsid protein
MWEKKSIGTDDLLDTEVKLISFGSEVKALGDGKVAGYLVRFGDQTTPDLTGDYFTHDTDFGDVTQAAVYYQHGLDKKMGKRKMGKGDMKEDDLGVWIEAQLNLRDEYEKAIYAMVEKGKLGWSSGTAPHLVEREEKGQAHFIKTWPLGLDASLTPTPAEPRNEVITVKAYLGSLQVSTTEAEEAGDASPVVADAPEEKQPLENLEIKMTELTQDQLDTLLAQAGKAGADAAIKSLPSVNAAGVQVVHDEADNPFKSMGDQLFAVKQATLTQGRELAPRLRALNIKALGANELVGSEGGFLLEPSFVAGLLSPLHDTGPFSSRAAKLQIGPNSNGITVRAVDETSRADSSRWGGILGYRLAEGGTKLATNPTFRLVELRLKKYAVLCYATEELLQDTTALAGIIQQGCSEELDFMVNDDILNGPGNAGPLGILNSGALVSVTKEVGQTAATVVTENIFKMWARLHPRSKTNVTWYINTDVTPQLYQLSLSVGTGGMPMYMAPGSLPNAPSGALLGRPVVETEFNPTLGTVGDIVLADMSQYVMIDRDVQAASSIHVQFLTDQVAYRFVYRCDGQPKIATPLTPYKGTGTLSPFVALATRA